MDFNKIMNLVNSFYIIRLLFGLISKKYQFIPGLSESFTRIDLFISSITGVILIGTLVYKKISIRTMKIILFIFPLLVMLPALLIPLFLFLNHQTDEITKTTISIFNLLFSLYSISFSIYLPFFFYFET